MFDLVIDQLNIKMLQESYIIKLRITACDFSCTVRRDDTVLTTLWAVDLRLNSILA